MVRRHILMAVRKNAITHIHSSLPLACRMPLQHHNTNKKCSAGVLSVWMTMLLLLLLTPSEALVVPTTRTCSHRRPTLVQLGASVPQQRPDDLFPTDEDLWKTIASSNDQQRRLMVSPPPPPSHTSSSHRTNDCKIHDFELYSQMLCNGSSPLRYHPRRRSS